MHIVLVRYAYPIIKTWKNCLHNFIQLLFEYGVYKCPKNIRNFIKAMINFIKAMIHSMWANLTKTINSRLYNAENMHKNADQRHQP